MKTSIIKIGNSRGIRIPKPLLEESKLGDVVDISVKKGSIIVSKPKTAMKEPVYSDTYLASLPTLSKTWNDPREDEAWKDL